MKNGHKNYNQQHKVIAKGSVQRYNTACINKPLMRVQIQRDATYVYCNTKTNAAVESNGYYIFLCACARVCVCVCGGLVWLHELGCVLARLEAYLSNMPPPPPHTHTGAILTVSSLAAQYSSTLSHQRHDFRGKVTDIKYLLIFSVTFI
jgi:hypothetical protein